MMTATWAPPTDPAYDVTERPPSASAPDLNDAEWRVIHAILESDTWSVEVAALERIAGLGDGMKHGAKILADLVSARWIVRWRPPDEQVIETVERRGVAPKAVIRNVPRPEIVTLHPMGEAWLGVTLIQPAQDGEEAEPRWGLADSWHFDQTGRHPGEPEFFVIEQDWGGLKRSLTLFEKLAAARAAAMREKPAGDAGSSHGGMARKSA